MEPEVSLPHSQAPATCPYPEPDQSTPSSHVLFFTLHVNIIPKPKTLFTVSLLGRVSHQIPCIYIFPLPVRSIWPTYLNTLDSIAISGKEHKSQNQLSPTPVPNFVKICCFRPKFSASKTKHVFAISLWLSYISHKGVLGVRKGKLHRAPPRYSSTAVPLDAVSTCRKSRAAWTRV